jgi:hypothetical protein
MSHRIDRVTIAIDPSRYPALDQIAAAVGWAEANQPSHVCQRNALREAVARKLLERTLAEAQVDPSWMTA